MPLFMDFHKNMDVTLEDVKNAHTADKSIQDRYNVRYIQVWVNEDAGTIFCLIEGPDKESCAKVHKEAHGNIAYAITEVEEGFYELLMGNDFKTAQGVAKNDDGSIDRGFRNIMIVDVMGHTSTKSAIEYRSLRVSHKPKIFIKEKINKYNGRLIEDDNVDTIIGVFNSTTNAVRSACEIQKELMLKKKLNQDAEWNITFKIGIAAGQPLTEKEGLFEETIRTARYVTNISRDGIIMVSSLVNKLCDIKEIVKEYLNVSIVESLNTPDEKFVTHLMKVTESNLIREEFNVESLCSDMGLSRPQLYRRITSLTGKAPNDWIRNLRLELAFQLLRKQYGNVSEIAYEAGFNNLSYFSKCFQEKFGLLPSQYLNISLSA